MDTFTGPEPTTEPAPARVGRAAPSPLRILATSVAVAGLTATGGMAVIISAAATSGSAAAAPSTASTAAPTTASATAPAASAAANATATPSMTPGTAQTQSNATGGGPFNGQPPQPGQGGEPGHASTGGS
jgi:hypothetical protein